MLDGWSEIDFAANEGSGFVLDWLWRQQNQHRLVLPKLLLLADLRWFHATQVFLLVCIFTIQLLHLALLCWSLRALGGWKGALWRTGAGLAAFCLFCPSQWENFTWGFQTCFVLPCLFATLSFIGLAQYWKSGYEATPHRPWMYLAVSILAAVGASYSLSNGNLVWPLLVIAAVVLRLPLKATVSYVIAGAASTALYLNNYTVYPGTTSALHAPLEVLKYMAVYFGSSWLPAGIRAAEVIGLIGLTIAVLLLLMLPSLIRERRPLMVQLILMVMFCLGTALITALGRLSFGLQQAFSWRYQSVALLFWGCLGLIGLGHLVAERKSAENSLLALQGAVLVIVTVAAFLAPRPISIARLLGFQVNAAAMALVTDVPDLEQIHWDDAHPEYVRSLVPYMRSNQLAVFHGRLPSLLGKSLQSAFTIAASDECRGEVRAVHFIPHAIPRAVQITGWAWDNKGQEAPSTIVTATNGVINGVGVVGGWEAAIRQAHPEINTNYAGFLGYVTNVEPTDEIRVYAITTNDSRKACYLSSVRAPS
jgi:hypothetical protein